MDTDYNETYSKPSFVDILDFNIYHPLVGVNKSVYIISQFAFVSLNIFFSMAVIALVVYLLVNRREVACRSPQYIPMLVCSFVHIGWAVWDSVVFLRVARLSHPDDVYPYTCTGRLAVELSMNMMISLVMLLVAAVIMSEALRFVALTWTVQKVSAAVLVGLAAWYVFVVIVSLFMLVRLKDSSKPCVDGYINYSRQKDASIIFQVFNYIVPALSILMACTVLLAAFFTRRSASSTNRTSGYVVSYNAPASATAVPNHGNDGEKGPAEPSITFNTLDHSQEAALQNTEQIPPPTQATLSQPQPSNRGFPFNVILAGVACIVLQFPLFYHIVVAENYIRELWLATVILRMMLPVFVALFWLLDSDIRAVWCCCCRRRSGSA